jgi:hypothetical protein
MYFCAAGALPTGCAHHERGAARASHGHAAHPARARLQLLRLTCFAHTAYLLAHLNTPIPRHGRLTAAHIAALFVAAAALYTPARFLAAPYCDVALALSAAAAVAAGRIVRTFVAVAAQSNGAEARALRHYALGQARAHTLPLSGMLRSASSSLSRVRNGTIPRCD